MESYLAYIDESGGHGLFIGTENINLLSTKMGFSWHYKRYSDDIEFAKAEEYARKNRIGLWTDRKAIAPWEWRKMR